MTKIRKTNSTLLRWPRFQSPEKLLRFFVRDSSVATFVADGNGTVLYANRSVADLLGYTEQELVGLNFSLLVHPEDIALARGQVTSLVSGGGKSFQAERRYLAKDGRPIWVMASVALMPGSDDEVASLAVQAISIDRQKRAEAALSESERRWNFALESAGQGVWEADIVQGLVYYSAMWRRMRGFAPDEYVDSSEEAWLARVHPEDRDRIRDITRRQNSGEIKRNEFEYRERHQAGHYIWISSKGAPDAWAADGTPTRVIGTDTDITQRKLAEEAMLALSNRLELALDASQIGVFEANTQTNELFWDERVRSIFGLDASTLAPDWKQVIHPEDAPETLQALANAIASRGTFRANFRIIRPDGEVRNVASQARYFGSDQSAPKLIGTNRDVTEEVALTRKLEAAKSLAEARNKDLEAAKALIENQSLHDALTGLPNRRYLDRILEGYLQDLPVGETAGLALLHIDLDRFKQINDTLGHGAGDSMLVHVARLLSDNAGFGNFVARVGGDEFIVVCPLLTQDFDPTKLAETLIAKIRMPVLIDGHMCRIGASIGIAVDGGAKIGPKQILMKGDIALYRAKSRGKNRFEFFSQALQDDVESTKRLADDILRGIEQNEFIPFYQPVVDAKSHQLVGVEALARWQHPRQGLLGPARFLKVAEDLNVLSTIDASILERAVLDHRSWVAGGLRVPSVSVNVSFKRLSDDQLIHGLRQLSIEPGTISFEFLESIFLDDLDDSVAWNIDAIRELGIGIDVDDFGTGHTSIVSLLRLNPDRFKIDQQLIAPIAKVPSQRRLVASIIEIGKTLGIKAVAEGVETIEQASILRDLGCDMLQGYAFAQPMSADKLIAWLGRPLPTTADRNSRDLEVTRSGLRPGFSGTKGTRARAPR
jgi:diguanylate cyclase (GGDEF)-like protein/PAS domain S-box-containing protein